MSATIETRRRLRAIRTISGPRPDGTAEERLAKIADIATGKISPEIFVNVTSPTLAARLAAGQASRSPRVGDKPKAKTATEAAEQERDELEKKKRKAKEGRDRKEAGGFDRSADLNG